MKRYSKKFLIISAVLFVAFIVFTLLLKVVDVKDVEIPGAVGVDVASFRASIGFSTLNLWIRDHFLYNDLLYTVTKYLGYGSILVCSLAALLGLVQWISKKSLAKVDPDIIKLGVTFALALIVYALFDKFILINYRPFILDAEEGLDPSYPSSHTVLACVSFLCFIRLLPTYMKGYMGKVAKVVLEILSFVAVLGRFLCGAHWITDILAGVLLSAAWVTFYYGLCGDPIPENIEEQTER